MGEKVPIIDQRIRLFAPMDARDPYVAIIGRIPMPFYAPTPMQAYQKADDWRNVEYKRVTSKAQRALHRAKRGRRKVEKEGAQ